MGQRLASVLLLLELLPPLPLQAPPCGPGWVQNRRGICSVLQQQQVTVRVRPEKAFMALHGTHRCGEEGSLAGRWWQRYGSGSTAAAAGSSSAQESHSAGGTKRLLSWPDHLNPFGGASAKSPPSPERRCLPSPQEAVPAASRILICRSVRWYSEHRAAQRRSACWPVALLPPLPRCSEWGDCRGQKGHAAQLAP